MLDLVLLLPWRRNRAAYKPKTLECPICGREFGVASLEFHVKACARKHAAPNALPERPA